MSMCKCNNICCANNKNGYCDDKEVLEELDKDDIAWKECDICDKFYYNDFDDDWMYNDIDNYCNGFDDYGDYPCDYFEGWD